MSIIRGSSKIPRNEQGFILVAVYLVVMALSIGSFSHFERSNVFFQAAERDRNKVIAFNMAETALDVALAQLASDKNYSGTNGYVSFDTPSFPGGYSIAITTPDNHPNIRTVQATGFAPDNTMTSRAAQRSSIVAYAKIQANPRFNFAVFAEDSARFTGNAEVDSYNSNNGNYGGTNKADEGDVGTNSIVAGSVTLNGNATIKGDVSIGPAGNPNTAIATSGNAMITGTRTAASQLTEIPVASTNIVSSGALSISGNNTVTLMPGAYRYASLKITGNGQLNLAGAVTIYVDGSVDIAGNGIATSANKPPNFLLYVTTATTVKIAGNGDLYAGIYAPTSDIKNTGNGTIYGAAVGKTYDQTGNGAIHFDEALKQVQGDGGGKLKVTAWQELNSLTWGT